MSATSYEEFTKEELINWIELCHDFFDGKVPDNNGGAIFSVYGRLIKFAEIKNNELAALREELSFFRIAYPRAAQNYKSVKEREKAVAE